MEAGVDINAAPSEIGGRTAIQVAVGGTIIVSILVEAVVNINGRPAASKSRTALQAAAEGGHLEALPILLDLGAISTLNSTGEVAEGGHAVVVFILLNRGADINAEVGNALGRTALQAGWGRVCRDCVNLIGCRNQYQCRGTKRRVWGGHGEVILSLLAVRDLYVHDRRGFEVPNDVRAGWGGCCDGLGHRVVDSVGRGVVVGQEMCGGG